MWTGACLIAGGTWAPNQDDTKESSSNAASSKAIEDPVPEVKDAMDTAPDESSPNDSFTIIKRKDKKSNLKKPSLNAKPKTTVASSTTDTGISFGAGTKSHSLFLSRGPRKAAPIKVKAKADKRKYMDVCCSVECPPIDSEWKEAGAELTSHFVSMVDHLLNKDRKALIHPWEGAGASLSKKSQPVKSKNQAKRFVNNAL